MYFRKQLPVEVLYDEKICKGKKIDHYVKSMAVSPHTSLNYIGVIFIYISCPVLMILPVFDISDDSNVLERSCS